MSAPPEPPTLDKALYAHFMHVKDALRIDSVVTSSTGLATQYRLNKPGIDNRLLKNITGISDVKLRCRISSSFGQDLVVLPPTFEKSSHGVDLFLTFNLLAIAPSIRLEAHFVKRNTRTPYLELALEFPFNDRSGKQLRNFKYSSDVNTDDANISFTSTGATTEGFTLVSSVQHNFGQDEKSALCILERLANKCEESKLHISLKIQELCPVDQAVFQGLISRLPGGGHHLLPSIGVSEFSNYPIDDLVTIRGPNTLMTSSPPNLMIPLRCPFTFGSTKHFAVDHLTCAAMIEWEGQTLLQEFCRIRDHRIALYSLKGIPIIAMNFGNAPPGPLQDTCKNLPNELEIRITLKIPHEEEQQLDVRHEEKQQQLTAVRDPYLPGLPEHNAYFVVTSHEHHQVTGTFSTIGDDPHYYSVSRLIPHPNSFLLKCLASAVSSLEEPEYHRFHPIALGQSFHSVESTDNTKGFEASASKSEKAWNWLIGDMNWNKEQRQLIEQLKCAKGGVTLATGTAGTGKTTVQMAMAVYFVKMGGRAACFATSNSNVATQAEAVAKLAAATSGSNIRVIRIVSASRGVGFRHMSATQALAKKVGHSHGTVSTIYGLRFRQAGQNNDNLEDWAHTVEACMLEEAEKAQLSHPLQYENEAGEEIGPMLDAWDEFRRYLEQSRSSAFWEETNKTAIERYAKAFETCKGHLIGISDIIMTANGNAQCTELVKHWARAEERYGIAKITRLLVSIDEVGKEQEIHVWNAILSKGLPRVPDFVMLLGDPNQLKPVNTSMTKDLQCNPFATRAGMSMLDRLLALEFPHTHLVVQQRMHPILWEFPSTEFYGSDQRSAKGLDRTLEAVEPGLKHVLDKIIGTAYNGELDEERTDYMTSATDVQTRLHYLDFGVRKVDQNGFSRAIPDHIKAVFDSIFPALQKHFGERTFREVLIIAAYGNAVRHYHAMVEKLKTSQRLSNSYYPRILTIDKAQGQESKMVILDNSMQHFYRMGFTTDPGRSNVAMTRAKEVFWIVGGPLTAFRPHSIPPSSNAWVKLKKLMQKRRQVHSFTI